MYAIAASMSKRLAGVDIDRTFVSALLIGSIRHGTVSRDGPKIMEKPLRA
jgi:hypothetical protein